MIIELLGGNSESWINSFLAQFVLDLHSVVPKFHIEVSRELTELVVKLFLADLKWFWALSWSSLSLHESIEFLLIVLSKVVSTGSSNEKESSELHI